MSEDPKSKDSIRVEAAARLVEAIDASRRDGSDPDLAGWRAGDPDQDAASAAAARVWDSAGEIRNHPRYTEWRDEPLLRQRMARALHAFTGDWAGPFFTPARGAIAACCVVALTMAVVFLQRAPAPAYETQIAQVREIALDDGSVVTLGAKSVIQALDFSDRSRRVELGTGEAFFSVAPDRSKPFFVTVGDTVIRVVGTKFNVKHDGGQVKVSVLEGVVQVSRSGPVRQGAGHQSPEPLRLIAGQQAVVADQETPGLVAHVGAVMGDVPGAWRDGQLSYEDATLAEIISDANRYRPQPIRIAGPSLADERLTLAFKISQIDQMLEMLPSMIQGSEVAIKSDGSAEIQRR